MPVPESAGVSLFLADGDSEAFFTRCAMERAQARHAREGRRVAVVWPRAGMDFGDWLQAGRDAGAAAGGYEGGRDEVDET